MNFLNLFDWLLRILSSTHWSTAAQYSDAVMSELSPRAMRKASISGLRICCRVTAASGAWTSLRPRRAAGPAAWPYWNPSTGRKWRGTEPPSAMKWSCSREMSSAWAIITSSCIKTRLLQPRRRTHDLLSVKRVCCQRKPEPASETWREQNWFCRMMLNMNPGSWRRSLPRLTRISPHTNWPRHSCCACVSSSPPLISQCPPSADCFCRRPIGFKRLYGWVCSANILIYNNVERKCNHIYPKYHTSKSAHTLQSKLIVSNLHFRHNIAT